MLEVAGLVVTGWVHAAMHARGDYRHIQMLFAATNPHVARPKPTNLLLAVGPKERVV